MAPVDRSLLSFNVSINPWTRFNRGNGKTKGRLECASGRLNWHNFSGRRIAQGGKLRRRDAGRRSLQREQQAAEAARAEEARRELECEQVARDSALVAEAVKLAATQALAQAREKERKMAVRADKALKED